MFSELAQFQSKHKVDQIDLGILDAVDRGIHGLIELCEAVGQPGKAQFMLARINKNKKRGLLTVRQDPQSRRSRSRTLTANGRRLLNKFRAHSVKVTCGGGA